MMDLDKLILAQSLTPAKIRKHQNKIKSSLESNSGNYIPVLDTCRPDNGGILKVFASNTDSIDGISTFVPSAGAASRYFAPLTNLKKHLIENNLDGARQELSKLGENGGQSWPLPPRLNHLMKNSESLKETDFAVALDELTQPKALQPYAADSSHTFFEAKQIEHESIGGFASQIYIIPEGRRDQFKKKERPGQQIVYLEQGPDLSTIRFDTNGEPILVDGELSRVPAGHGCLSRLFPEVARLSPESHSVLIRNIDNVAGIAAQVTDNTRDILAYYCRLRTMMQDIRSTLENGSDLSHQSRLTINQLLPDTSNEDAVELLWRLQTDIFHTPDADRLRRTNSDNSVLLSLYRRPFNVLAQVPNTAHDIGGTPCFVEMGGKRVKLCLEAPHASDADKKAFLGNPDKATHFNPVFVLAELTDDANYYDEQDEFWLLARKKFLGKEVLYHETALYELLGNSIAANVIFCEIPRFQFNPHKSLEDAKPAIIAG